MVRLVFHVFVLTTFSRHLWSITEQTQHGIYLFCLQLVFSTFLSCSQMSLVFYHSVIHGLGFFIC